MTMGRTGFVLVAATLLAAPSPGSPDAAAQPAIRKPAPPPLPAVVDLTEVARIAPAAGLIDRAIADDGAGRLAYVAADAATRAEVVVIDVATGAEQRRVDVAALTAAPARLYFVGAGAEAGLFVIGRPLPTDDQPYAEGQVGALYDAAGKEVRRLGPAESIAVVTVKGKPAVAVRTVTPAKKGGDTYKVELFDPKKGKRIGKARSLTLVDGRDAKLGFRVNHWTADGTVAVGIKDGEYSRKEDMRMPDSEGRFDLVTGTLTTTPIGDVVAHTRRFLVLAQAGGPAAFARVAEDLTGVELWRDDHPVAVRLDQPFELYDPKSLAWGVGDDGTLWLGLAVDPWNRPAVDRKKADPAYFDVFRVAADGAATREGRVLAPKARFDIGATAGHVWLLERNVGFDRGGKALTIFRP